jgi:hypothetical protein
LILEPVYSIKRNNKTISWKMVFMESGI